MAQSMKRTPLYETHLSLGGRMVPFAGWDMPVQYESILAEARAVRSQCGIFDVSHMGRLTIEEADAGPLLDWVHSNDVAGLPVGRARYGLLCNEEGGIIDDGIVYRLGEERYLLVANASNKEEIHRWLVRWQRERYPRAQIQDITAQQAMIAFQGPQAVEIMQRLSSSFDPQQVRPFRCIEGEVQGRQALIARTGYTGEDGVEVILPAEDAPWLWNLLQENGATPCGLGARDVLRLEAALLLHGNDMDTKVNPIEAGLERFVKADKEFCGGTVIREALERGVQRKLVGFQSTQKGSIPRTHCIIADSGSPIGEVTSGGYSPTLDRNIGLGYVAVRYASLWTRLQIDIRGRSIETEAVPLPFYSRKRS